MTETSQNLLDSCILDFGTLLYPDDTDTIQGFQLCRLIHAFEDDAAAVPEAHLHRGRGKRDIVRHLHGLRHFHQKVVAGIPDGIEYLADHQGLAFFLQQLLNQLHGNMVALRTAITANSQIYLMVPVMDEIKEMVIQRKFYLLGLSNLNFHTFHPLS